MPNSEFENLMAQCENLITELNSCQEPQKRKELLKQLKLAIEAANQIAYGHLSSGLVTSQKPAQTHMARHPENK